MVNLVEDWEVLEEYAGDKRGFYQILYDATGVEIRGHALITMHTWKSEVNTT